MQLLLRKESQMFKANLTVRQVESFKPIYFKENNIMIDFIEVTLKSGTRLVIDEDMDIFKEWWEDSEDLDKSTEWKLKR